MDHKPDRSTPTINLVFVGWLGVPIVCLLTAERVVHLKKKKSVNYVQNCIVTNSRYNF